MELFYLGMFKFVVCCFGILLLFVAFCWLFCFLDRILTKLSFVCFEYLLILCTNISTSLKAADPAPTVSILMANIIAGGCLASTGGDRGEAAYRRTGALQHQNILTRNNFMKKNLLEQRNCFA